MRKISSRLPVLLVLAAVMLGAWIETASAGRWQGTAGSPGSAITVSSTSRSGATTYSGDPDVGQNGNTAQKRSLQLWDGRRGVFPERDTWATWIWAMWNLRIAR